jgi:chromosome condensin MukBEF complex kleisin-like MukF subunit
MSATYIVNGYVDIRIKLTDRNIHASQSSSPSDIAELVKMEFECKIGNCDILGHKIMLQEVG